MPIPQLDGDVFITDGGMETTLIFHDGVDLPHFASFVLLEDEEGRGRLRGYFRPYIEIARERGVGIERIRGVRANASTKSHAELDESTELDSGDPQDLARRYADLRTQLPHLNVVGGCCGTDHRHIEQISSVFAR